MGNLESLQYFLPEIVIVIALLFTIILDLLGYRKYILPFVLSACALIGILLYGQGYSDKHIFLGMLTLDSLSYYFKCIILLSTTSIILISNYSRVLDKEYQSEYNMLLLSILLGMFLMTSAVNLIMIYLAIELVSIPSYILAGILKNDKKSNEASLKYVIFGSFASGLMLYGLSLLYGVTGSFDLAVISESMSTISNPYFLYTTFILILVGFGYKISMAPMHYWTPDVYEGSPTTITAFLSVAPKAAGFAILIRFFLGIFDTSIVNIIDWTLVIAILSAATMTIGNVLALRQTNVKRMLAYSTISHVGFMLMAFSTASIEATVGIAFYMTMYIFMSLSSFYMVIFAENKLNAKNIEDWAGLGYKNMILGSFMVVSLVSLAGLPPTSGFIGKVYLFKVLFSEEKFYWLAIIGVINSVISLYYYFKIVKSMYFKELDKPESVVAHPVVHWSIIILSSQNLLFYFYWEPLYNYITSIF